MSIRHEIHCVNCGESKDRTGRVRVNSENKEEILIDCKKCGVSTTIIISLDESGENATIVIENLRPEEYVVRWKNVTKSWDPILVCPFCGNLNFTETIQMFDNDKDDVEHLFKCDQCRRVYEVERA